jgi:hypothetical protein
MSECAGLQTCPFFNDKMAGMPAMAAMFKNTYCKTNNEKCARYIVSKVLGPGKAPIDLFPNQIARSKELINAVKAG